MVFTRRWRFERLSTREPVAAGGDFEVRFPEATLVVSPRENRFGRSGLWVNCRTHGLVVHPLCSNSIGIVPSDLRTGVDPIAAPARPAFDDAWVARCGKALIAIGWHDRMGCGRVLHLFSLRHALHVEPSAMNAVLFTTASAHPETKRLSDEKLLGLRC